LILATAEATNRTKQLLLITQNDEKLMMGIVLLHEFLPVAIVQVFGNIQAIVQVFGNIQEIREEFMFS